MMKLSLTALAALIILTQIGRAQAADLSDSELVDLCVTELKSRQAPDAVQTNTQIAASSVQRSDKQQVVDVQVTEAEGRRVTAKCIIRGGKVFDFKG